MSITRRFFLGLLGAASATAALPGKAYSAITGGTLPKPAPVDLGLTPGAPNLGLAPGQVGYLYGRPGSGKSSLALFLQPTHWVTTEQSRDTVELHAARLGGSPEVFVSGPRSSVTGQMGKAALDPTAKLIVLDSMTPLVESQRRAVVDGARHFAETTDTAVLLTDSIPKTQRGPDSVDCRETVDVVARIDMDKQYLGWRTVEVEKPNRGMTRRHLFRFLRDSGGKVQWASQEDIDNLEQVSALIGPRS